MEKRQSLSLKLTLVGDPMVGKTSMALAFTRGFFSPENTPDFTQMPETYCKELMLDNTKVFSYLWWILHHWMDVTKNSGLPFIMTSCFIICYAVDNPSSLANVENQWLPEIHELCPNALIILAGTKHDLQPTAQKTVSEAAADKLAKTYHFDGFHQCSSKSLESIEKVFANAVKVVAKEAMTGAKTK